MTTQFDPSSQPRQLSGVEVPRSDDAERGVLSCFLQNPVELLDDAQLTIPNEAFYHTGNQLLYKLLHEFRAQPKAPALDLVTFSQFLIDKGLIDKVGGPAFLAELTNFVPTPAHYGYYKGILRDKLSLRRVIEFGTNVIQSAYEYQEDIGGLLDRVESAAMQIRQVTGQGVRSDEFVPMLDDTYAAIEKQMISKDVLSGYSTGFPWLDQMTGGLRAEYWVIGARPSMGKTSLVMNLLEEFALIQRRKVGVFSLEMSGQSLIRRLLSGRGDIPHRCIQNGKMDKEMMARLNKAYEEYRTAQIRIDDSSSININHLKAKVRRWVKQWGCQIVMIDYLQKIARQNRKGWSLRDEYDEISGGLAELRKELNIPIVVLAQLNRECEKDNRRPRNSDVEGCGRIEQDADTIILLSQFKECPPKDPANQQLVTFDITKQREGPRDYQPHIFQGSFTRFEREPADIETLKLLANMNPKQKRSNKKPF